MNSFTRFALAGLLGAGFATAAAAEEWTGPRLVGSGENLSVEYAAPSANIVGGAHVRTTGSGESATTQVLSVQGMQAPRAAVLVGSGENQGVIYLDPAAAPTRLAQRGPGG